MAHVDAVASTASLLKYRAAGTGKPHGGGWSAPVKKPKISDNDTATSLPSKRK